ncbi:porin family protein [Microbulbifer agarilyticus]|uniref:outer membrane beta-barrel protein n=1 Tax=Microbulbifer agarilyticus TaxID=260552 RepID=UPI001C93C7D5|nr:outer membrane beta-barrel protein [Microbulbifer agarilyticus]MBY6209983.1 porin family protein [Microbulbifer agarilyticus]
MEDFVTMKIIGKLGFIRTLLVSLIASTIAHPAIASMYLGTSVGLADSYPDAGEYPYWFKADFGKSPAYTFFLGYRVNSHISVEANYSGISNYRDTVNNPYRSWSPFSVRNTKVTERAALDLSSFGAGLLISTDIKKPYFAGLRLGVHKWDADWSISESEVGTAYDVDPDGVEYPPYDVDTLVEYKDQISGQSAYYGALVGWNINKWQLGVEFTFRDMDTVSSKMSAFSVVRNF